MPPRIDLHEQRQFFDVEKNRYPPGLITRPPTHTHLETESIIQNLPKASPSQSSVADFGSGSGRLTIPLLKKGYSVTAIDISPQSLRELKAMASGLLLESELKTLVELPQDASFHAVVGTDILHHVKLEDAVPKIFKSLKKGGTAIFSEPAGTNPSWYIYPPMFMNWHVEKGVMQITPQKLRRAFLSSGFREVTITGVGIIPRPFFNWSRRICAWHDKIGNLPLLRSFAYRYLIVAKK